ncbi:MAG: metallophosphoesterase [Chloroflexi bacterium]|nr:metallophosphoesterase [Chloroflexota bacterium]
MRRKASGAEANAAAPTLTRRRFLRLGVALGAGALVASYPVCIERSIVLTNHYRVAVPHLPLAFAGLRVVHLTDLHYGPLVPLSLIRSVVARANALHGDLIVCTGDYVHHLRASQERTLELVDTVWQALAELTAPLGVYSVLGNHDHWADTERSLHWLARTGQDVQHRAVVLERDGARLWLVGAGDYWEDHRALDDLLDDLPTGDCRIVLAHNPDTADSDYAGRVDLMIAGHTHGGQVRLPGLGASVVPVRNKRYIRGLLRSDRGEPLFISSGIGWAGLPVRLACYPEIAVLELVTEGDGA